MASVNLSEQASTPANSKRKASAVVFHSPPRRPMPAWNPKLDALGHCYEGEVAEDERRVLRKGAVESFLARAQTETTKHRRISEVKSSIGASRDAVLANLRLLSQAHQRLTGTPSDTSVRYGKEKLSLGEMLPMFDDLSKLWQEKAENSAADLDKSNAILVERDQLRKERDHLIEKLKAARQERDVFLRQRKSTEQERDTLLRERDYYRQESEKLKQEQDKLHQEKEQYHQQLLEEKAAKRSTETEMVPRSVWSEARGERDEYHRRSARYREERDDARLEHNSTHGQMVQFRTQVLQLEENVKDVRMQLNTSKDMNTKLNGDLNVLNGALKKERQEFKSRSDEFETEVRTLERNHELKLRDQRRILQGTQNSTVNGQKFKHELNVRRLTEEWEREKAELVASTVLDRGKIKDLESAAEKTKQSFKTTMRNIQLNSLKLSKQTAGRNQETINGLVVAIAVLRSSSNNMLRAVAGKDGMINSHIVHSREIGKKLTKYQEANDTLQAESNRLQKELHGKEEELDALSAANKANILNFCKLQDAHADCEHHQRLQLGRADRETLFEDFLEFAQSLSEKGMVFKGQESSQDVDVCFCVLSGSDEALCVIRRLGDAFTIWHSKLENCSTFPHAWRRWLCLGKEDQGKPMYISLISAAGGSVERLQTTLPIRTISDGEVDAFRRTEQF